MFRIWREFCRVTNCCYELIQGGDDGCLRGRAAAAARRQVRFLSGGQMSRFMLQVPGKHGRRAHIASA